MVGPLPPGPAQAASSSTGTIHNLTPRRRTANGPAWHSRSYPPQEDIQCPIKVDSKRTEALALPVSRRGRPQHAGNAFSDLYSEPQVFRVTTPLKHKRAAR